MKKITVKKWLITCMVSCLGTSACYAQDSLKVSMILFEYDDSGSIVVEEMVNDEETVEDESEERVMIPTFISTSWKGIM